MRYDRFDLDWLDYKHMCDPRDYVFEMLYGQDSLTDQSIIEGYLGFDPGLSQLLLLEYEEQGWLLEDNTGRILLNPQGNWLSEARLDCWPSWGTAMVRPDAPPFPTMGKRLRTAVCGYVFQNPDKWPGNIFKRCIDDA